MIRSTAALPIRVNKGSEVEWHQPAILIKSAEGIGKTRALFHSFPREALDDAMKRYSDAIEGGKDGSTLGEQFCAFGFRSLNQARAKAAEFEAQGNGKAVVMAGFWHHYENACSTTGQPMISRSDLSTCEEGPVLAIKARQPAAHELMEKARRALWSTDGRYNAGTTILFGTHALIKTWEHSHITRIWSHPEFDPEISIQKHEHLRSTFNLGKVVIDEPEIDDVLYRCQKSDYDLLVEAQGLHKTWKSMSRHDREAVFDDYESRLKSVAKNFEDFNEWMRSDLSKMETITVDYERIPFGVFGGEKDIYRRMSRTQICIGPKEWLFSSGFHITFLTTEELISDVISMVYKKRGQEAMLSRFDLDLPSTLPPVKIPLYLDRRASKTKLRGMVDEIVESHPDAKIIADTLDHPSVTNFTRMKGANHFQNDDLYIIPMFIGADQYAELNALGIYIEKDDIIETYYGDNLNQACGRNRGFRESSIETTKTTVVVSHRLYKTVIKRLVIGRRYVLDEVRHQPWKSSAQ